MNLDETVKMEENLLQDDYFLSEKTFKILDRWHSSYEEVPWKFIKTNEFKKYVDMPLKRTLIEVINRLPYNVIDCCKYQTYNGGEIYDFYWDWQQTGDFLMNFYYKNRIARTGYFYGCRLYSEKYENFLFPHFFIFVSKEMLEVGFYMGSYRNIESMKRFIKNCKTHESDLLSQLQPYWQDEKIVYGDWQEIGISEYTWEEFLKYPTKALECKQTFDDSYDLAVYAAKHIKKEQIIQTSSNYLISHIVETLECLFPLFLLATSDDPMPAIYEHLNRKKPYPLSQCAEDTGFEESDLEHWVRAIERKGQAILQGPPGTGKTYLAERLARHLIGGGDGFWELVQFHPAYSYEDFIQGIRPQTGADGRLSYQMLPGRFLEFCKKAESRKGRCILIIDEINRANLSQVFGELMYLLDDRDRTVKLASGEEFSIPANVRIIGTMNTADRSIALVDHALRRRFAFISLYPNYEVLRRYHQNTGFPVEGLIQILEKLNQEIDDRHYQIGISFFLTENLEEDIEDIWRMEIEPYLEEYFFDQPDKVEEFRWENIKLRIYPL